MVVAGHGLDPTARARTRNARRRRRCTLYAAAGGAATLALSLATFLTQPRRDEHYALPCLLLAIGALLMVAAFVAAGGSFYCSRGTLALGELELGAKLLILGAAALSIEITIRLLDEMNEARRSRLESRTARRG